MGKAFNAGDCGIRQEPNDYMSMLLCSLEQPDMSLMKNVKRHRYINEWSRKL